MDASIQPAETNRPLAISVVCVLGFVWWAYVLLVNVALRVFDLSADVFPLIVPSVGGGATFFQAIFLGAIWRMRQWGLYGYVAVVLYRAVIYYVFGQWMWLWFVVPLLVIAVTTIYYKRLQ